MPLFRVTYDASLVVEVETGSFEEAEDLAAPIATDAEERLEAIEDGKLLPHGTIVTVGMVHSTRNLETDEELLH